MELKSKLTPTSTPSLFHQKHIALFSTQVYKNATYAFLQISIYSNVAPITIPFSLHLVNISPVSSWSALDKHLKKEKHSHMRWHRDQVSEREQMVRLS